MGGLNRYLQFLGTVLVAPVLLFSACSAIHEPGTPEVEDPEAISMEKALAQPEVITFQVVKDLVLEDKCLKCHQGGRVEGRVDLSSREAVLTDTPSRRSSVVPFEPDRSSLFSVLNARGKLQMPPPSEPQLSEDEKSLISLWISNGAIAEVGEAPAVVLSLKEELNPFFENPLLVDYAAVNKYVFNQNCNECHSESGSKADTEKNEEARAYRADLTSYDSIMNNIFLEIVKPGKPSKSDLFQSVALQEMPAAADGYAPLDALRVKLLKLWILNCAVETVPPEGTDHLIKNPRNPEALRDCNP